LTCQKRKFKKLGEYFGMKVKCVLTKTKGPFGRGIGPALEMMDVVKILKREDSCHDIKKLSLELAGVLLEMTGKAKNKSGAEMAKEILDSGKAFEKFKEIVKAQRGSLQKLKFAPYKRDVFAKKSGKIVEIDNKKINELAIISGCPADKLSGLYLHSHLGDKVSKGKKILAIYSESESRLKEAVKFYEKEKIIRIR